MYSQLPSHDELAKIAKNDPARLEQMRQDWVNEIIDNAPSDLRKRLRGLQFQIDCQRRLHSNPMGACVEISRMMYDSLNKLNKILNGKLEGKHEQNERDEPLNATVLAFPSAG